MNKVLALSVIFGLSFTPAATAQQENNIFPELFAEHMQNINPTWTSEEINEYGLAVCNAARTGMTASDFRTYLETSGDLDSSSVESVNRLERETAITNFVMAQTFLCPDSLSGQ